MFFDLAELVVSSLDRETTRRLVRLTIPGDLMKKHLAEKWKAERADATEGDEWQYVFDWLSLYFFEALQRKGRAALRRPASSQTAAKTKGVSR